MKDTKIEKLKKEHLEFVEWCHTVAESVFEELDAGREYSGAGSLGVLRQALCDKILDWDDDE